MCLVFISPEETGGWKRTYSPVDVHALHYSEQVSKWTWCSDLSSAVNDELTSHVS